MSSSVTSYVFFLSKRWNTLLNGYLYPHGDFGSVLLNAFYAKCWNFLLELTTITEKYWVWKFRPGTPIPSPSLPSSLLLPLNPKRAYPTTPLEKSISPVWTLVKGWAPARHVIQEWLMREWIISNGKNGYIPDVTDEGKRRGISYDPVIRYPRLLESNGSALV